MYVDSSSSASPPAASRMTPNLPIHITSPTQGQPRVPGLLHLNVALRLFASAFVATRSVKRSGHDPVKKHGNQEDKEKDDQLVQPHRDAVVCPRSWAPR